jgi:2-methylcitrate dehydratase PrpD
VTDDLTAGYPKVWPVRLVIETGNGPEHAASDYPRGNAENPVSTEDLERKFSAVVGSRFGTPIADAMLGALHSIEQCRDMRTLFSDLGNLGTQERPVLSSAVP